MSVKTKTLSFPPSDSPDVVRYKLYVEEASNPVTFESMNIDLGNNTSVELNALQELTTLDGIYNLGVTAVDDAGNESSMTTVTDVPLDFRAPNPVGVLTIR